MWSLRHAETKPSCTKSFDSIIKTVLPINYNIFFLPQGVAHHCYMAVLPCLAISLGKNLEFTDFILARKVNDKEQQERVNNKIELH